MAILRSSNIVSEQRWNVSDVRAIESAIRNDFDTLSTSVFTGTTQGYILRGFTLVTAGAINSAARGLQMVVEGGAVMHINASVSGTIFQTPSGTANQVLDAATNTNVSGSFAADGTNYVGIDYNRFADSSTNETKYIWNSAANDELTTIAPAAQVLTFKIIISTSVWAANVLPVAIVKTLSGNVTSITDARWNLFSLETGGISPNPNYTYPWSDGRVQPPITTTDNAVNPFVGGDKQLSCQKDWMNAVMSQFKEIKGTPSWFYAPGAGSLPSLQSLRQDLGNTIITGKGSIAHGVSPVDKTTRTSDGQINWDQNVNLRVVSSILTYTLTANPTSTDISLADDQVAYVTFVRDVAITPNLIFTAGSADVKSVGNVTWTSGLQVGDYIKVAINTVAGYYKIQALGTLTNSYTDSAYAVTLTSVVSLADGTTNAGTQAQYAYGTYNTSPTPSTNRHIYIANRISVSEDANVYWLFLRSDNTGATRVYARFLGSELASGEDRPVDGTTSEELLKYTGSKSQSDFLPEYVQEVSPGAVPQITNLIIGSGASITGGQYFKIYSSGNYRKYRVWFKVSGSGTEPVVPDTNSLIEVDILTGDTPTLVASKLAAALTASTSFTATSGVGTLVVTNTSAGTCNTAINGNVGAPFSVTLTQAGTGPGNFSIKDGDNLTLGVKEVDLALGNIQNLLDEPTYDETVEIVASGATPPSSLNVPVSSGAIITLPNNSRMGNATQYYSISKGVLEVYLNGQFLTLGDSWLEYGIALTQSNQIQILFDLVSGDEIQFRININGGSGAMGPQGPPGVQGPQGNPGTDAAAGPITISTKTSSYSALITDKFLLADCTGGNLTFTLPSAASASGRILYCKKADASNNFMFVQAAGIELVDGTNSISTNIQFESFSVISDGSQWWLF